MLTLYQKIIREKLNVRQTEDLVKKYSDSSRKSIKVKKVSSSSFEIVQIENDLISHLGTKVVIRKNNEGKGKIQIEFYSEDDLQRIVEILKNS